MNNNSIINLSDMKPGEKGRVLSFRPGSKMVRGKLLAMGFTPGAEFMVTRVAPLGDPLLLEVRGSSLSLRKGETTCLCIERVGRKGG